MSRLTVILTLKDRFEFTVRWIRYMQSIGFSYHILVADGSVQDNALEFFSDAGNYVGLNLEYKRYPEDKSYYDYYLKLNDTLNRTGSEYILLADNDDFLLPSAFGSGLDFLDENKDYVACGGPHIYLSILDSEENGYLCGKEALMRLGLLVPDIDEDDARQRIQTMMDVFYAEAWYMLIKRKAFLKVSDAFIKYNFEYVYHTEVFAYPCIASYGKIKNTSDEFYIRQHGTSSNTINLEPLKLDLILIMLQRDWSEHVNKLINAIKECCGFSDDEFDRKCRECFRRLLFQMYGDYLQYPPFYTRLAQKFNLREKRVWRLARSLFLKARGLVEGYRSRKESERFVSNHKRRSELENIQLFVKTYDPNTQEKLN